MEYSSSVKLKALICIEYPGIVEDEEKMLSTLGGLKKISEVYSEENRRMELRFRPSDIYCKPTCGERHNSTSLLIKVMKRKRKKVKKDAFHECEIIDVKTEPIGVIHTTFKFENLCDFQYLPMMPSEDGILQSIYLSLIPKEVTPSSWMDGDSSFPLFLPPATFSRMDSPQDYRYRRDVASFKTKSGKSNQNIVCRTRQKRTHYAIFKSYKDPNVPTRPLQGALSQARCKFLTESLYGKVKKEFDHRPIWSKSALRVRTQLTKDQLKYILPTMSFYFNTGPWRNLWVVFGHDPRKEPKSWIYQTFDFRIRQSGGMKNQVEAKRSYSNYVLPYKSVSSCKKKTSVIQSTLLSEDAPEDKQQRVMSDLQEECYIFHPGMIPPYRQMFYQYCDLDVVEIQELLQSSIVSPTASQPICTEKNGWLPPGIEVQCRNIISQYIEMTLRRQGKLKEEQLAEIDDAALVSDDSIESNVEGNETDEDDA